MVNAVKGEVTLQFDGAAYRIKLDFNAFAEFEAEIGGDANAMQMLQNPAGLNATKTRALFWAGLKQCHPDMTKELAGQILSANLDKLGDAMATAFPDADLGNVAAG